MRSVTGMFKVLAVWILWLAVGAVPSYGAPAAEPVPAYIRHTGLNRCADSRIDSVRVTLSVDFAINSYTVDPSFSDNFFVLDSLRRIIERAVSDPGFKVHDITIGGSASPDGRLKSNMELARRRMLALYGYISREYSLPEGVSVSPGKCEVCWPEFREAVAASFMAGADTIVGIASIGDDGNTADSDLRLGRLKKLDGGRTWRILASDILPKLRNAVGITLSTSCLPEPEPVPDPVAEEPEETSEPEPTTPVEPDRARETCPAHQWHLATNAVEWAMAIANITGEYDFARRWSAALSLHYSGWNYGKATRKFRTFIVRPEVRFWLRDCHKGFFINAHLQMAYYNFAMSDWNYRIQDADGKRPALGGGLGFGYRVHLDRQGRWSFQADLGAGVYHLDYDRFENRSNGAWTDRRKRTWVGIDHFGISLIYNFKSRK